MSDIKIFVSHRIDQDSETIDNPLFHPVRCGAVFDKRENKPNIPGDDTGDNISEKRLSYCELTVQYWVWKNVEADYYGFCHYRRYFSFKQPEKQMTDIFANVEFAFFEDNVMSQIDVDADFIIEKMNASPIALTTPFDTRNVNASTVYEQYKITPHLFVKDLDILLEVIHDLSPSFDEAARKYMKTHLLYPCSMFIMKKRLFFQYCEWLFPILAEYEKRIDTSTYNEEELRGIGHLGERCLGIFYTYINQKVNITAVFFQRLLIRNPSVGIKPHPRFENQVTIVTASSNYYVPYVGVMLKSLLEKTEQSRTYEIFILHTDVSEINRKKIKALAENYPNASIDFYDMAIDISGLSFKCSEWVGHISNETFYRTLLHKVFAAYEKVIYLDSDEIVRADVADFFDIDLGDNLLCACLDPEFIGMYYLYPDSKEYTETVLKIKNPLKYFQGGVLLINIKEFRKTFSDYELAERAVSHKYEYRWVDQDTLNAACHGRAVMFADMAWNVMAQHKWDRIKTIKQAPFDISKQYFSARENPKIIHYAGGEKPWSNPEMDFADEFWKVARISPFYEVLLNRQMHETAIYQMQTGLTPAIENLNQAVTKTIYPAIDNINQRLNSNSFLGRMNRISPKPLLKQSIKNQRLHLLKDATIRILSPFFPIGTRRRAWLKKVYEKLRGR
jgi:lipopolysaccharide biosynthesis glycosyltransferase